MPLVFASVAVPTTLGELANAASSFFMPTGLLSLYRKGGGLSVRHLADNKAGQLTG